MTRKYILEDGRPKLEPDILKWGKWFESADRHVALTEAEGFTVSTVFLGLDHAFGGTVPILFETMVFKRGDWDSGESLPDQDCERYSTIEEARAGHEAMVAKWSLNERIPED